MSLDATPAESSPATAAPSLQSQLDMASPAQVLEWRQTGDLSTLAAPAESAPATVETAPPASTDATPPTASEPVKPKTEERFQTLLADRAKERDRADRLERELAALRTPTRTDVVAASSTAPADPEPNPDDATVYPDGQYDRKFIKDQAAWEVRQVLAQERAADLARRQTETQEAQTRRVNEAFAEKVAAAKAKHEDFEQVAFGPTEIRSGSPIDLWILDSDLGADVLYALQTAPGEVRRISGLSPVQQLRELAKLELTLSTPVVVKTVSDAPAPPRVLGDRAVSAADPATHALKSGNIAAYIAEANKRELAERRM